MRYLLLPVLLTMLASPLSAQDPPTCQWTTVDGKKIPPTLPSLPMKVEKAVLPDGGGVAYCIWQQNWRCLGSQAPNNGAEVSERFLGCVK